MKPTKFNILLAFAAIYFVWGSTYLAISIAIESMPPFFMAGARFILSGAVLYGAARYFFKASKPTAAEWRSAGIVGVLLLLGGNGGVVWAEQFVPTGIASIIIATVPIWMVICSRAQGGHKAGPVVWLGIALGFAGIWVLVKPDHLQFNLYGVLVLLAASFLWALGSVFSKLFKQNGSAFLNVGMQMLVGGLALFLAGFVTGEGASFNFHVITARSYWAFLYLVLFGSFIGFTAYIWLIQVTSVARVSTYAYVNPVVAVLLGHLFAKEPITHSIALAGGLILSGVFLIQTNIE